MDYIINYIENRRQEREEERERERNMLSYCCFTKSRQYICYGKESEYCNQILENIKTCDEYEWKYLDTKNNPYDYI